LSPARERKEQLMSNEIILSDANFDEKVKKAKGLVLVDFYADWCMPCKMLAPAIEKLATEFAGKVTVGKLNVDANFHTASGFSVSGIPTLILFKDGSPVERLVGLQPADVLKGVLNKHL
jgi:thioredoxin 1